MATAKVININGFPVPLSPVEAPAPYRYQGTSDLPLVKWKSAEGLQDPQGKPDS